MPDPFSQAPTADDLANKSLLLMEQPAFDANWKKDLDIKDHPAWDVLAELLHDARFTLQATSAQQAALQKPITLRLKGRSRLKLIEEVCLKAGFVPAYGEKATPDGKRNVAIALKPLAKTLSVAFAGSFRLNVESVKEHTPHATGLLTVRCRAEGLPEHVRPSEPRG
jgi:hypothetical protein